MRVENGFTNRLEINRNVQVEIHKQKSSTLIKWIAPQYKWQTTIRHIYVLERALRTFTHSFHGNHTALIQATM